MATVRSFSPIARADATRLILGSMPGKESLRREQYYGLPRNAFWSIAGELLGFDATAPYAERCSALARARIALWDVLAVCDRESSLDADIDPASEVANDFPAFLKEHPRITRIYFNGAKAEQAFQRHVVPRLTGSQAAIPRLRLPSTSPANAGMRFAQKLAAWRCVVEFPSQEPRVRLDPQA